MNHIDEIKWKPKPTSHKHSATNLYREFSYVELVYLEDALKALMESQDWAFESGDVQQLFLDIQFARMLEKDMTRTEEGAREWERRFRK